jgi:hypothetical protein
LWRSRHGSDPKPHSPLFRSRCGSGGPDICGVDKPSVQIHQPLRLQSDLQPLQDAVEGAVVRPDAVPVVRALPGTVSLRKVPPRSTTAQNPEDGVEHLPGVTPLASAGLRRRERSRMSCHCHSWSSYPVLSKGQHSGRTTRRRSQTGPRTRLKRPPIPLSASSTAWEPTTAAQVETTADLSAHEGSSAPHSSSLARSSHPPTPRVRCHRASRPRLRLPTPGSSFSSRTGATGERIRNAPRSSERSDTRHNLSNVL